MSLERDIEDEVRFHLEMRTRANIEKGMSPEEARRARTGRFLGPLGWATAAAALLVLGLGIGRMTAPIMSSRMRSSFADSAC